MNRFGCVQIKTIDGKEIYLSDVEKLARHINKNILDKPIKIENTNTWTFDYIDENGDKQYWPNPNTYEIIMRERARIIAYIGLEMMGYTDDEIGQVLHPKNIRLKSKASRMLYEGLKLLMKRNKPIKEFPDVEDKND